MKNWLPLFLDLLFFSLSLQCLCGEKLLWFWQNLQRLEILVVKNLWKVQNTKFVQLNNILSKKYENLWFVFQSQYVKTLSFSKSTHKQPSKLQNLRARIYQWRVPNLQNQKIWSYISFALLEVLAEGEGIFTRHCLPCYLLINQVWWVELEYGHRSHAKTPNHVFLPQTPRPLSSEKRAYFKGIIGNK